MATAIDEATIVQAIMHGLASGGGAARQVVAVAAIAILRTHRGDQRGDCLHLSMQEKLKAVAKDFFGHEVGISQVVKHLRLNEHADLANAVTAQHKCRNLAAHPAGDLDVRVRPAFEKTFIDKDPVMDNDPWKQEVKNVEHVVKETSNNDVAAERSETAVAPRSSTWEQLVLRLLIADAGRHFSAACTRKKTRDFPAQVDADAKPPFVDVSTQCHALDILNCGPLRVVPLRNTRGCLSKCLHGRCEARHGTHRERVWLICKVRGYRMAEHKQRHQCGCGLSGLHNQREAFCS